MLARSENLLDLFKVDLWNINIVAALADRFDPQTEAARSNWKEIAATSGKVLYREVDFNIEREAAQSFADNFAKFDAIKIPSVYPELSSGKVVTMEYGARQRLTHSASMRRGDRQWSLLWSLHRRT